MLTKEELGKRLKQRRTEREMTLKELEARSSVSATHISQIERGLTSPTVGALQKLARALDKNTSYFVEIEELPQVSIVAKGSRDQMAELNDPKVQIRSLTRGIPGGQLRFLYMTFLPTANPSSPISHEGEECGTVLKGQIDIHIGSEKYTLKKGDSVHYKSSQPHRYHNNTKEETEVLWVSTSPDLLGGIG